MYEIAIETAEIRATLVPGVGAAIAALEAVTPTGRVPILRPSAEMAARPFEFASTILAPFSNRISGGGFWFDNAFHAVPVIGDDQTLPIHGDALHRPWGVIDAQRSSVTMELQDGKTGPFKYSAKMTFQVSGASFRQHLRMTNTGKRMPFGGGFHPFFPRHADTTLQFQAGGVWLADGNRIPTSHAAIADCPLWDFSAAGPLPEDLLDNGFSGWIGPAEIRQPSLGIAIAVSGSSNLQTAIVFAPHPSKPFFCFEPVSHPVDAVNLAGSHGMQVLDFGESLEMWMEISWKPISLWAD